MINSLILENLIFIQNSFLYMIKSDKLINFKNKNHLGT